MRVANLLNLKVNGNQVCSILNLSWLLHNNESNFRADLIKALCEFAIKYEPKYLSKFQHCLLGFTIDFKSLSAIQSNFLNLSINPIQLAEKVGKEYRKYLRHNKEKVVKHPAATAILSSSTFRTFSQVCDTANVTLVATVDPIQPAIKLRDIVYRVDYEAAQLFDACIRKRGGFVGASNLTGKRPTRIIERLPKELQGILISRTCGTKVAEEVLKSHGYSVD